MYSLNNLDEKLHSKHLKHRNGFYVEVGAYDGVDQSNTLFFEKKLGWTGLLIEPIPSYFNKCKKNRPGNAVENCALSDSDGEITLLDAGLMTVAPDSVTHHGSGISHANRYVNRFAKNHKVKEVKVKCCRLQTLFDKYKISKVDLFSLDVEGYEYKVLKGINFSKTKIDYILLECNVESNLNKISSLLSGYKMIEKLSNHDYLFKVK